MPFSAAWRRPGELVRGGGGGRGRGLPARREGLQLRLDGGARRGQKLRDLAVGVREREEQIRDREDISLSLLTGRQHVRLAWHATSANVVKM